LQWCCATDAGDASVNDVRSADSCSACETSITIICADVAEASVGRHTLLLPTNEGGSTLRIARAAGQNTGETNTELAYKGTGAVGVQATGLNNIGRADASNTTGPRITVNLTIAESKVARDANILAADQWTRALDIGLTFGEDAGKTETKRADQRRITIRRGLASIHGSRNTDSRLANAGPVGAAVRVDGANGDIAGKADTALADQRAGALVVSGASGQNVRNADSSSADKRTRAAC
jgi:hypothetical protein